MKTGPAAVGAVPVAGRFPASRKSNPEAFLDLTTFLPLEKITCYVCKECVKNERMINEWRPWNVRRSMSEEGIHHSTAFLHITVLTYLRWQEPSHPMEQNTKQLHTCPRFTSHSAFLLPLFEVR